MKCRIGTSKRLTRRWNVTNKKYYEAVDQQNTHAWNSTSKFCSFSLPVRLKLQIVCLQPRKKTFFLVLNISFSLCLVLTILLAVPQRNSNFMLKSFISDSKKYHPKLTRQSKLWCATFFFGEHL